MRRKQPLVEARAVIIAGELVAGKREVGVGVRPVHDHLDPLGARELHDLADREDLAGEVRDVTDVDNLGPRRDGALDAVGEVVLGGRGYGDADLLDTYPLVS